MADPAQPQQGGGILDSLTNIVGNPLLQGALGAYFNAISAPRHTSTAGRVGLGGLGGLQAFDVAEKERNLQPLQAAQINLANARIPQATAATNLANARTQQIAGSPEANKAAGAQLTLQLQGETDPAKRQILQMLIPGVTNGVTKPEKVAELLQKGDIAQAQIERDKAQTSLANANAGLAPARGKEIAAETGAASARASEAPSAIKRNEAETRLTDVKTAAGGFAPKTTTPEQTRAKALSALNTFKSLHGGPPVEILGRHPTDPSGSGAKDWHDRAMQALTAEGVSPDVAEETVSSVSGPVETAPAAGSTAPPWPSGVHGTYNGKSGWYNPTTNEFKAD